MAAAFLVAPGAIADQEAEGGPEEEEEERRFSFNAFGTLGVVHSSEDRADFVWLPSRPDGPGHSDSLSFAPDSILGAQLTFRATPKLTAVVQVVAEQTAEDDYAPQLEWANVRYAFTPDFSVRVGRMALPAFLASEYRKVSYANPWVRPPIELYGMAPLFTVDGVDATYVQHAEEWTRTFGVTYGSSGFDIPGGRKIEVDGLWNVNATAQRGGLTGRVAIAGGRTKDDIFGALFDGFRAFGPEGEVIASRFEADDTPMLFASAGAEYDPGSWFAIGEVGWFHSDSLLGEKVAGYLTAGYRWGTVTPYLTYSRAELLSESSVAGLSLTGLPPHVVPLAAGLNAALNERLRATIQQQNLALGGRWDLTPGMALKLQVDFVDALGDSFGSFVNRQPDFDPGGTTRIVSFATVFVF